jgi:hypothetical protein
MERRCFFKGGEKGVSKSIISKEDGCRNFLGLKGSRQRGNHEQRGGAAPAEHGGQ